MKTHVPAILMLCSLFISCGSQGKICTPETSDFFKGVIIEGYYEYEEKGKTVSVFRSGDSFLDIYLWEDGKQVEKFYISAYVKDETTFQLPVFKAALYNAIFSISCDKEYAEFYSNTVLNRARLGEPYERVDSFLESPLEIRSIPESELVYIKWGK